MGHSEPVSVTDASRTRRYLAPGVLRRAEMEIEKSRQGEGRLTDEVLEEKLREGKGPLPFIPGGEKTDPPVPESAREDGNESPNQP